MRMKIAFAALLLGGCAATPEAAPSGGSATLRLGETARIAGAAVRALRIEEDSRCPSNVQCIQAGTVRLAVALRDPDSAPARALVLRLDEPAETAGLWLLLAAVCPAPRAPGAIEPARYRFTLSAARGAPPPPLDHICPPAP